MTIASSKLNQCIHSKQQRPLLASPHRKRRYPITFIAWRLTKGLEISPDKNHQSYLQHQNPNNHYSSVSTRVYHIHQCQQGLQGFTMVNHVIPASPTFHQDYKCLPWPWVLQNVKVSARVYSIHQCQQGLHGFAIFISVNKCLPCL